MADRYKTPVADPAFVTKMFNTTMFSWLWAILRIYVGYQWLKSGWGKFNNPAWIETGAALKGYWVNAVKVPAPPARPAITYDWYRSFLNMLLEGNTHTWFAKFIVYGEILVGVCLIVGLLTGFAAFGGAMMNFNFMLAGSASTNPVLFFIAVLLILAWKGAGYYGLDRWVLPIVGTPWRAKTPVMSSVPGEG